MQCREKGVKTIERMDIGIAGNDYGGDTVTKAYWLYAEHCSPGNSGGQGDEGNNSNDENNYDSDTPVAGSCAMADLKNPYAESSLHCAKSHVPGHALNAGIPS